MGISIHILFSQYIWIYSKLFENFEKTFFKKMEDVKLINKWSGNLSSFSFQMKLLVFQNSCEFSNFFFRFWKKEAIIAQLLV